MQEERLNFLSRATSEFKIPMSVVTICLCFLCALFQFSSSNLPVWLQPMAALRSLRFKFVCSFQSECHCSHGRGSERHTLQITLLRKRHWP